MASGIELAHLPTGMFSPFINGQEILEEEYNEDFEPTDEEIKEYCTVLGLDPVKESDLLYIAKEAIKAPLPPEWKPCKNEGSEEIYYFNFQTGESSWDHPCDKYYVELLERDRAKKRSREISSKAAKKNTHAPSIKPLMPGTTKLQGAGDLPSLSKKGGLNPLHSLPPLRSGLPQLGPLKLPSGMTPQSQPTVGSAAPIGGDPSSITRAPGLSSQINASRLSPQLSAPTRPTLNPEKEIMKGISLKFEEEDDVDDDDDESDEELSDKDMLGASGFHLSKFGNIMDAGDLGVNLSVSDEDISAEIREMQDGSGNNTDDELQQQPRAHYGREAAALGDEQQNGIRRSQRPTTARGQRTKMTKPQNPEEDIDDDTGSSGSLLGESRLPENVNLVDLGSDEIDAKMQAATTAGLFQQSHNLDLKPVGRQATAASNAGVLLGNTDQAIGQQAQQQSLNQQIAVVKRQHEEELAKLRKSFDEELAREKDSLKAEQEITITTYKNELSTQLASEQKRLQGEQQASLSQLKNKLKIAQEDDEAQLQEEKSNFLRTLTQQVAREKQEAEEKMRKDLELQLSRLRSQLELDKTNEEKAAQKDLEDLKKTLQISRREELDSNEAEFEQQLADLNNLHQSKLEKARQELEAEYTKMMGEAKASLEEEHKKAVAEISTQYKSSRTTEEERLQQQESVRMMENELEVELAAKKAELQQQHQQQLDGLNLELKEKLTNLQESHQQQETKLKEELANKLEQVKSQCEKDNNAELESLRIKLNSAKQDLQTQITQVEEELENKRTEAEQERLTVQQLLTTIKSEKEAAEVQRLSVEENKKELAKEEQRIQQLRSTTAAETDRLLAERQSELKDDIEQEQSILAELKKRREQLQKEIDALTKEKSKLEATIEELRKQECIHRRELEGTQNQIKESKAVLTQLTDELKTAQERSISKPTTVDHDGNKEAPAASLQEPAASQESEDTLRSSSGHSSTTMSVRELASPSPTTDEVMDEAVNKPVRVAWEEKHEPTVQNNELNQVQQRLINEAKQLKQAQDFLQKQKHSIKKRRADLMQAQKSWTADQERGMSKQLTSSTSPRHKSIAQKVEKRFEKEAAAISNAEDQLMLTDRLLMMKEHRLTQLEDSVTSNVDNSSVDNWEPSSPNLYLAYGRDQYKHHRLRTHSLTPERLTKSSVTMTTDTDEVVNSKQASRRKRYKSSSKQLSCDDEADNGDVTNSFDHANVPSSEIMSSLNKINSQLGEVLTRLTHPSTTTSSIQPYPSADPLLQPRRPDKTEEELRSKWLYYLGHLPQQTPSPSLYVPDVRSPFGSSLAAPVDAGRGSSMVRKSTSEMYKSQTDWLKTFQQETTYNRPTLNTTPLMTSNKNMPSNLAFPTQSRTPKFVLDSKNNIHFVHV